MNYPLLKPRRLTVEEFRALEATAPEGERWELIRGVIVKSMAGGTVRHNDLVQNVASTLRAELRRTGSPCRTSTENVRIDLEDAVTSVFPDVIVKCGPRHTKSTAFHDASAIVEVLSQSTRLHDLGDKLDVYMALPSIRTVLFIEQTEMRVTSHTKSPQGWLRQEFDALDDVVELNGLGVSATLAQIYEEIEFD